MGINFRFFIFEKRETKISKSLKTDKRKSEKRKISNISQTNGKFWTKILKKNLRKMYISEKFRKFLLAFKKIQISFVSFYERKIIFWLLIMDEHAFIVVFQK